MFGISLQTTVVFAKPYKSNRPLAETMLEIYMYHFVGLFVAVKITASTLGSDLYHNTIVTAKYALGICSWKYTKSIAKGLLETLEENNLSIGQNGVIVYTCQYKTMNLGYSVVNVCVQHIRRALGSYMQHLMMLIQCAQKTTVYEIKCSPLQLFTGLW